MCEKPRAARLPEREISDDLFEILIDLRKVDAAFAAGKAFRKRCTDSKIAEAGKYDRAK